MAQIKVGTQLVAPKGLHVYKNGAWQRNKVGRVWHNGMWIDFITYLLLIYDNGNNIANLIKHGSGNTTFDSDRIYLKSLGSSMTSGGALTSLPVDVTKYKKLKILWKPDYDSSCRIGLKSNPRTDAQLHYDIYTEIRGNIPSEQPFASEVDISSLLGNYYIGTSVSNVSRHGELFVYKIWLE